MFETLTPKPRDVAVWAVWPGFQSRHNDVATVAVRVWLIDGKQPYVDKAVVCWDHDLPWPDVLADRKPSEVVIVPEEFEVAATVMVAEGLTVHRAPTMTRRPTTPITAAPGLEGFFVDAPHAHDLARLASANHTSREVTWV